MVRRWPPSKHLQPRNITKVLDFQGSEPHATAHLTPLAAPGVVLIYCVDVAASFLLVFNVVSLYPKLKNNTMIIEIPDDVFIKASRSEDEVKKDVIAFLYQKRVLTLEQAAVLAGVTRLDFQRLLAERNIPIHYDVADLEMDLRHVADIKRQ